MKDFSCRPTYRYREEEKEPNPKSIRDSRSLLFVPIKEQSTNGPVRVLPTSCHFFEKIFWSISSIKKRKSLEIDYIIVFLDVLFTVSSSREG
ncbi:hypothetical protein TNIN_34831 [Trichonephila inaurata madagascariensis]|uniref:Uncharacterized protein n=1 Tax=Trichonephila inaurata madagascariensis TaxID=2747483 RepID=A0A8X7CGN8_9ARAC|nr:hypothetical protein TNIN_34831 [Trichonephila inaurata madagascariensis]